LRREVFEHRSAQSLRNVHGPQCISDAAVGVKNRPVPTAQRVRRLELLLKHCHIGNVRVRAVRLKELQPIRASRSIVHSVLRDPY
jgi:hypothetical protein